MTNVQSLTLVQELDLLHDRYVVSINEAVAADDYALAEQLAAAYETDAIRRMAEREGKTHLLPLQRRRPADTRLRRWVGRLRTSHAA